jgi:hypothetical protein
MALKRIIPVGKLIEQTQLATERMLGPYSVFWGNLFSNYAAALITTILIIRTKWVTDIPQKPVKSPVLAGHHDSIHEELKQF